ncbi:MAG: hypothetical protein KKG00_06215 [Bacteroidetes bacterium]|nr:hypothetical protein [Bacteroidota bacterium]
MRTNQTPSMGSGPYCQLINALAKDQFSNSGTQAEVVECTYTYFAAYLSNIPQQTWYPAFVSYMQCVAICRNEPFFSFLAYFRTVEFYMMTLRIEQQDLKDFLQ